MQYKPEFKGPIEGYVVNFITRNYWKVQATQERGDMLQEAWIVFDKCVRAYPGVEDRHFMALFKTAWGRRFLDFTQRDSNIRVLTVPLGASVDEDGELTVSDRFEPVGDWENDGALACMLRTAPSEVSLVLKLFLAAPQELLELALSGRRPGQVNRLLGLPADYDAMASVREYFGVSA